jgi:hypothetical protein
VISTAAAVGGVVWTVFVGLTSKIWARVEKTIVELAGDALDIYIRDFASRYRKRYLEHLKQRHRTFDVKGLSTQGIYALEIEQVYVELTVDPTMADNASVNPIAKTDSGRHDIWTFLNSPQMTRQDFAILGAPGSGKTTLLKHITLGLAANHGKFEGLKRLPVLLFIRDHAAEIGSNPKQTIADVAEQAAIKMGIPAPAGWFARELARGRCLVMLDGLDEVADAALRKTVAEWVESQLQAFGANRFLVSSRPFGYKSNPLNRVTVLEVRPFSSEQSERFIKNWYLANEVMSAQKDDEGVRIAAREGAADLMSRIRAKPALAELAVNPLLLTMIANVHRYRSSLPGRRVELYAEICEVFLGKRQQARGMELDLTPAQKKRALQPLAFHMMCGEEREIPVMEAVQAIRGPLALVNDKIAPDDFLRNVENSSGLLLERENGIYSFAHLTFQEYLAASHLVEEKLEEELAARVAIPWWHEVIRLYVALADATRIVEACISDSESGVVKLTLAVECLEEALAVRPDLRTRVESIVIASLEDSDPERARLAAETKLALRLRRLSRIDDDHYADRDLISCAEYQLFIDDRQASVDFRQPDHWKEMHFPAGMAREPVLGMRPSDAEAFCHWLSDRQGGEWTYQIPDRDLDGATYANAGYWATTRAGSTLYGTPGLVLPLTLAMLRARLNDDRKTIEVALHNTKAINSKTFLSLESAFKLHRLYDPLYNNLDIGLMLKTFSGRDYLYDPNLNRTIIFDGVLNFDRLSGDLISLRDFTLNFRLSTLVESLNLSLDRDLASVNRAARTITRLLILDEIALLNYQSPKWRWFAPLLRRRKRRLDERAQMSDFLRLYLSLATLEERIEGKLLAFEGIRITKVRKAVATKGASAAITAP